MSEKRRAAQLEGRRRDLAILALVEAGATFGELAQLRARDIVRASEPVVVSLRLGQRTLRLTLDRDQSRRLLAYYQARSWQPSEPLFAGRQRGCASPDLFRKVLARCKRNVGPGSTCA